MHKPFASSSDPFHPIWSGLADYNVRPTLLVARDGSGFRPVDISDLGGSGNSGTGTNTTTNGQVGITGSNGLAASVVTFNGLNAIPVVITSGQTIVSGANIILTGTQVVDPIIDYNVFAPLGFNGGATSKDWVSFTTLSSYFVPSGKTLKIDGYSLRMNNNSFSFMASIRELMYGFSLTGSNGRPSAPSLLPRTITGFNGLATGATYSYRVVFCNHMGRTSAGPTGVITLSGAQNSVDILVAGGAATVADSYFEIYRSPANSGSGSEVFLAATPYTTFGDTVPDSELSSDIVPPSDTSSGTYSGFAYPSGIAPRHVIIQSFNQTSGGSSFAIALDVVYRNVYGKLRTSHFETVPASTFTEIQTVSSTGGVINGSLNRVPRKVDGHEWDDIGINQIVHVGFDHSKGNFAIFGYAPLFYTQAVSGSFWFTEYLPKTISIPAGKEVAISVGSTPAIASTGRVDLIIYGRLI